MTLLARAREAGLAVALDRAGELVLRGPKRLATLAAEVLEAAEAVREALRAEHVDTAVTITAALEDVGWAIVYSTVIGAEVLFIRDQAVTVPAEFGDLPRFDRDELALLGAERPSPDRLCTIVDVKREMGGRVVQDTGERLTPARQVFPNDRERRGRGHGDRGCAGRAQALAGRLEAEMTYRPELAALVAAEAAAAEALVPPLQRELLEDAAALGYPRLPLRPAVSVIAGRQAWETFTATGTAEDVAAAQIAVASRLPEKAQPASPTDALAGSAPDTSAAAEKPQRARRCAFCAASLVGRRRHARYCSGRCRAAGSDARRTVRAVRSAVDQR